jgi:hypothetical protein
VVTVIGLDSRSVVGARVDDTIAVESSFASVVVLLEQFVTLQLTGQSDLKIVMPQSRRPSIVNVAHAGVSTHGTDSPVVIAGFVAVIVALLVVYLWLRVNVDSSTVVSSLGVAVVLTTVAVIWAGLVATVVSREPAWDVRITLVVSIA